MKNESESRRRARFWRNAEYNVDTIHQEFENRLGDKWINDKDKTAINRTLEILAQALSEIRMRCYFVLEDQLDEYYGQLNLRDEKDFGGFFDGISES